MGCSRLKLVYLSIFQKCKCRKSSVACKLWSYLYSTVILSRLRWWLIPIFRCCNANQAMINIHAYILNWISWGASKLLKLGKVSISIVKQHYVCIKITPFMHLKIVSINKINGTFRNLPRRFFFQGGEFFRGEIFRWRKLTGLFFGCVLLATSVSKITFDKYASHKKN